MGTELQKIFYSESLNRDMTSFGADRLTQDMFHFFGNMTLGTQLAISHQLMMGPKIVDVETCENFKEWFGRNAWMQDLTMDNYEEFKTPFGTPKLKFREWFGRNAGMQDLSGDNFEKFKTLLVSPKFRLLSYYFYIRHVGAVRPTYEADHISLKSYDNVVLQMSKMVAMSQSEVLKDMLDHTDGKGDIPVPGVPYDLLSRITSFCKKKYKFDNLFDEIAQLLKSTMDRYKAWVTGFVKSNHSIFSDLHQVACQLHIPNLLELTSRATKDMKGKTVEEISDWYSQMPREPIGEIEEISEWYSTLSISRMLSPLGIELEDSFLAG